MFDSNVLYSVLHHRPSPPFHRRAQDVGNGSYYLAKNAIPPALLARLVEQLKKDRGEPRTYGYRASVLKRVLKFELYAPGPNGEIAIYRWGQHAAEYKKGVVITGVYKEVLDWVNMQPARCITT